MADGPHQRRRLIQGYGDGGFRLGGIVHAGSILLLPGRVVPWAVTDPACITFDSLAEVVAARADVELLLIGCGRALVPLPAELRQALRQQGIVAESMDTGAACRTYNVVLAEDRKVAAALIAV